MPHAQQRFQAALECHRQGQLAEAQRLYRETLALDPDHALAHNNLGLTLAAGNRIDAAAGCFRRALELEPQSVDAARNLAQALHHLGRYHEALECCRHLLAIDPQPAGARLQIVALRQLLGETGGARQALLEAAAAIPPVDPAFAHLCANLESYADEAIAAGDTEAGWRLAGALCRLQPEHIPGLRMLAHCLRRAHPGSDDPGLDGDLRLCLASRHLDHQPLTRPCLALLKIRYPALAEPESDADLFIDTSLGGDPLFLGWLRQCLNSDPAVERQLGRLRSRLLEIMTDPQGDGQAPVELPAALALHCFANEYLFPLEDADGGRVDELQSRLLERSHTWRNLEPGDCPRLLILGCYRPWYRLPSARELDASLGLMAPEWMHEPRRRLLSEPLEEQILGEGFTGGHIEDRVSLEVRRQYEQSPYPRWQCLEPEPADSVAGFLRHLFENYMPPAILEVPARILIAGCGTGEHAIRVALRHPDSGITAIDLSRASLSYARRQAQALEVPNIVFRQADILELPDLGGPFQVIESVGVLHHMADPQAGLLALLEHLDPHGVIKLGLYSRIARRHVRRARERIAELGLGNQPGDIRTFRARILDGLEPQLEPLLASPDFYSLSNCRDLLFHVQEHQYDLVEIEALLDKASLELIGLLVPDPKALRRFRECHPAQADLRSLAHWHAFEQDRPDTFAGMYQFWCRRV